MDDAKASNINFPFLKRLQAVQTMIVGDSNKQHEATLGTGNAAFGIGVEWNSLIFLCLRNMNLLPTSVCTIARCAVLPVQGHHDDFMLYTTYLKKSIKILLVDFLFEGPTELCDIHLMLQPT